MVDYFAVLFFLSCVGGSIGERGGTCESPDADVLIMGAGMAGISAAKTLYDNGVRNFLILEGTNRIGGRIREEQFSGVTVELGANWIQGVTGEDEQVGDNPIWNLVRSGQCPLNGTYFGDLYLAYENMNIVNNETDLAMDEYFEADEIVVKVRAERSRMNLPDISVREAFEMNTTWEPSTNVQNLIDWFLFDFCFAERPDESSLYQSRPLPTYEVLGDYDYLVSDQTGFSSIVGCVGKDFLSDETLKLNTNVTKIRWSDECVCAETMQPEGPHTFCGKFGIVTFSVGVLREWVKNPKEEPNFEPQLPKSKTSTINAFDMVHYLKIFVNFTDVFWNTTVDFVLRADEERGRFPVIIPVPLPGTGNKSNILLITVVENEATRILGQSENQTKEEIMQVLTGIYGDNIPEIDSILIPDWYKDPFYLGSFSSTPIGVNASTEREIAKPEGNLYISGEVTDPDYSGFVHGAYFSGVATGRSVVEAIEAVSPVPALTPSPTPSGQSALSPLLVLCELSLLVVLLAAKII